MVEAAIFPDLSICFPRYLMVEEVGLDSFRETALASFVASLLVSPLFLNLLSVG